MSGRPLQPYETYHAPYPQYPNRPYTGQDPGPTYGSQGKGLPYDPPHGGENHGSAQYPALHVNPACLPGYSPANTYPTAAPPNSYLNSVYDGYTGSYSQFPAYPHYAPPHSYPTPEHSSYNSNSGATRQPGYPPSTASVPRGPTPRKEADRGVGLSEKHSYSKKGNTRRGKWKGNVNSNTHHLTLADSEWQKKLDHNQQFTPNYDRIPKPSFNHQNRPVIIQILGPGGSGKSTVCKQLEECFNCLHISVSDELKRVVPNMEGLPAEECLKLASHTIRDAIEGLLRGENSALLLEYVKTPKGFGIVEQFCREFNVPIGASIVFYCTDEELLVSRLTKSLGEFSETDAHQARNRVRHEVLELGSFQGFFKNEEKCFWIDATKCLADVVADSASALDIALGWYR